MGKYQDDWNRNLEDMKAWLQSHPDTIPPREGEHRQLSEWASSQKSLFNRDMLKPDRQAALQAIGFPFAEFMTGAAKARQETFLRRIELAKRYFKEQGDLCLTRRGCTLVQSKALSQDELKELAEWMHKIRERRDPDSGDPQITAIRAELPMFVWDIKSREYKAKTKENRSATNRRINEKRSGKKREE